MPCRTLENHCSELGELMEMMMMMMVARVMAPGTSVSEILCFCCFLSQTHEKKPATVWFWLQVLILLLQINVFLCTLTSEIPLCLFTFYISVAKNI